MTKRFCAITLALAATAISTQAATLVWSANLVRNGFDTAAGTDLPAGSVLRAGYFDLTDAQIIANSSSPAGYEFLLQHFTEFSLTHIGEGVGNTAGHFSDSDSNLTATATTLAGKQIYLWAVRSFDNTSDATKIATAVEHGILYMPFSENSFWRFPSDPETGSTQISLSHLTDATSTNVLPGAKVLAGGFGIGTSEVSGKPNFALQAVPEPASAGLAIVGGMALLLRRRRRA